MLDVEPDAVRIGNFQLAGDGIDLDGVGRAGCRCSALRCHGVRQAQRDIGQAEVGGADGVDEGLVVELQGPDVAAGDCAAELGGGGRVVRRRPRERSNGRIGHRRPRKRRHGLIERRTDGAGPGRNQARVDTQQVAIGLVVARAADDHIRRAGIHRTIVAALAVDAANTADVGIEEGEPGLAVVDVLAVRLVVSHQGTAVLGNRLGGEHEAADRVLVQRNFQLVVDALGQAGRPVVEPVQPVRNRHRVGACHADVVAEVVVQPGVAARAALGRRRPAATDRDQLLLAIKQAQLRGPDLLVGALEAVVDVQRQSQLGRLRVEHGLGDRELEVVDVAFAVGLDGQMRRDFFGTAVEELDILATAPLRQIEGQGVRNRVIGNQLALVQHRHTEVGLHLGDGEGGRGRSRERGRGLETGGGSAGQVRLQAHLEPLDKRQERVRQARIGLCRVAATVDHGVARACVGQSDRPDLICRDVHQPAECEVESEVVSSQRNRVARRRQGLRRARLAHRDLGRVFLQVAGAWLDRQHRRVAERLRHRAAAEHGAVSRFHHRCRAVRFGDQHALDVVVGDGHVDRIDPGRFQVRTDHIAVGLAVQRHGPAVARVDRRVARGTRAGSEIKDDRLQVVVVVFRGRDGGRDRGHQLARAVEPEAEVQPVLARQHELVASAHGRVEKLARVNFADQIAGERGERVGSDEGVRKRCAVNHHGPKFARRDLAECQIQRRRKEVVVAELGGHRVDGLLPAQSGRQPGRYRALADAGRHAKCRAQAHPDHAGVAHVDDDAAAAVSPADGLRREDRAVDARHQRRRDAGRRVATCKTVDKGRAVEPKRPGRANRWPAVDALVQAQVDARLGVVLRSLDFSAEAAGHGRVACHGDLRAAAGDRVVGLHIGGNPGHQAAHCVVEVQIQEGSLAAVIECLGDAGVVEAFDDQVLRGRNSHRLRHEPVAGVEGQGRALALGLAVHLQGQLRLGIDVDLDIAGWRARQHDLVVALGAAFGHQHLALRRQHQHAGHVVVDHLNHHTFDIHTVVLIAVERARALAHRVLDVDHARAFGKRIVGRVDSDLLRQEPVALVEEQFHATQRRQPQRLMAGQLRGLHAHAERTGATLGFDRLHRRGGDVDRVLGWTRQDHRVVRTRHARHEGEGRPRRILQSLFEDPQRTV